MVKISVSKNNFVKRLSRTNVASYHAFRDGGEPIVFLKYGKCDCGEKLFEFEQILHALEHEFVELESRNILKPKWTKKIRIGFDMMAFKWHKFTIKHHCELVEEIYYG